MVRLIHTTAIAGLAAIGHAASDKWLSPNYTPWIFQFPLPIPPVKAPSTSYTRPDGRRIDFYEINIRPFEKQIYPNLGTTTMVGYDGMAPGPTFRVTRGTETVVRFINRYDKPSSIHLHGSYSRAPFDGWAEDQTYPGYYKDYYYPNAQPMRTLWYHDHAMSITAVNAYFGQAGFYILDEPAVTAALRLPSGGYDVPLMIASKQFEKDGKLHSPVDERDSLWGDVTTVNGQPWPYFKVEYRKYKFRLLDASVSRSYKLYLVADSAPSVRIPFTVVGGDAGYLSSPQTTSALILSMAERWEIVIDFAKYRNQNLTLMNELKFQTNEDYAATDRVMRFVVGDSVTTADDDIPAALATLNLPAPRTTIDKSFTFEKGNGGQWTINGVTFADIPNRILAFPAQGRVQRWELINKSGGWSHPIHIHLVDFQVVKRTGGVGRGVEKYEAAALKDVVYLGENEKVEVVANFAPWSGVYMFHCHNLVHEDHDMMAAFNVSRVDLAAYGYPEQVSFVDPLASIFAAKPCPDAACITDLNLVAGTTLPWFASLDAYPDARGIEEKLALYYEDQSRSSTSTRTTLLTATSSTAAATTATSKAGTTTSKAATTTSKSSSKTTTSCVPTGLGKKGGCDDD